MMMVLMETSEPLYKEMFGEMLVQGEKGGKAATKPTLGGTFKVSFPRQSI